MSSTYSFLDVNCSIIGPGGAFSLGAGAAVADEGITFAPNGEINTMQVGADGLGQHSLHGDKSGTVTVRLLKTSPVNAQLNSLYAFQTSSSASHGANTIGLVDSQRGDAVTAYQVAFKKAPDLSFQKQAGLVEWIFDAVRIERSLGA